MHMITPGIANALTPRSLHRTASREARATRERTQRRALLRPVLRLALHRPHHPA